MLRSIRRFALKLLLWFVAGSFLLVLAFRWIPPPGTALMVERKIESWIEAKPINLKRSWRPWEEIPNNIKIAVIASEDQRFAQHWGFDTAAIKAALSHNQQGGSIRGASTLSQQVAKNLFLWSGRSWLRKGFEAWFTALMELLWPKQRILEVYLNSAEWGDGVFGVEAAAQYHFKIAAPYLSRRQASLLAAVLPNPHNLSAGRPSAYVNQRANWIRQQIYQLGGNHYLEQMSSK